MSQNYELSKFATLVSANSSTVTIGNVAINSTALAVGGTTVNSSFFPGTANNANNLGGVAYASYVQNTDSRTLSGNLVFSGANVYYNSGIFIGANVVVNTSSISIGNSSVNTYSNSTHFYSGNTTVYGYGNSVAEVLVNASGNNILTATNVTIQTSPTVNTVMSAGQISLSGQTINSTSYTGLSYTSNNASYLGGVAAANYLTNTGTFTISGVHTHNANLVIATSAGISANGSYGTNNQVLTSNGSTVYWAAAAAGVNTASQYSFTNTVTFSNTVTLGAVSANGSVGTAGQLLASNGTSLFYSTASAYFNVYYANGSIAFQTVGATAPGSNTQIQFNDSGFVNASAGFTFDKSANGVTINGSGGLSVGAGISIGSNYPVLFSAAPQITWITGTLSLSNTSPANTDIDLTTYLLNNNVAYNSIVVYVQGQYVANSLNFTQTSSGTSTASQSHLLKAFRQGTWSNGSTWFLEGGTVFDTYNGDSTNFAAGAINAGKALLVANSTNVVLRLIQRTTPANNSATYYSYRVEIQKW